MNLNPETRLIKAVHIVDIKGLKESQIKNKLERISKNTKDDEIYLASTNDIEAQLETLPEGQVLTIHLNSKHNSSDIEDLVRGLADLRDYYPDLTVKIIDKHEIVDRACLPEDAIIKK